MTATELAELIADELEKRDDIASATPMTDDEDDGADLIVTTQGGTEFMVQVLPYTSK